ncbi:MAG: 30S ribosomal protein S16 [Anaerolineae bacterium]
MVKIRLRRVGAKKQPSYRIVVASSTSPRDGRFLEVLGHYNPRTEPETVVVNVERSRYWLGHGAQPTEAVERLLKKAGAYEAAAPAAAEAPAVPAAEAAPAASEA